MKLAVKNSHGIQDRLDDKIKKYYVVADDYDFSANAATDVSDLQVIWDFYHHKPLEYKVFRSLFMTQVAVEGFQNIGVWWQKVAAENFTVGSSDVASVLTTDEERIEKGIEFHVKSKKSRQERLDRVVSLIYNTINKADAQEVITDISQDVQVFNYIEFGLEGTVTGDAVGFFDYINSTTGTKYANAGFRAKTFTPITSLTIDQIADKCLNILNGLE